MTPIFIFMHNFGSRRYKIVISDLAASNFYELEDLKCLYRKLLSNFGAIFCLCIILDPRLQKTYELHELSFVFVQIKACQKPVHVKIIFITHCVVK